MSTLAAQLRDIARQITDVAVQMDGEVQPNQVELVKTIFQGTVVEDQAAVSPSPVAITPAETAGAAAAFSTPQQQQAAVAQFVPPAPVAPAAVSAESGVPQPCKYCQQPIYLLQSPKTGGWYTTNSTRRNDLHNCAARPAR
jgi:hypothetical protein